MFPRRLILGSSLLVGALFAVPAPLSAPVFAAPAPLSSPVMAGWKYAFAEDELESRWSWRGALDLRRGGEARLALGWKDARNTALLTLRPAAGGAAATLWRVSNGTAKTLAAFPLPARGELGLQKVGGRLRVLWNGTVKAQVALAVPGAAFGTATRGAAQLQISAPQPTEAATFRDDFMRAQGPGEGETPGEWRVAGTWKTSGSLGPKSDAALNPNPFVFRAQGQTENVARAGAWWWSDYSVSAAVRATQTDARAPLRAGLEAFSNGASGLRAEVNFAGGVAVLKSGDTVLAQSAPFAVDAGQWHRLRLDPGPGIAKFYVDGVLRASAPGRLAQGSVALRAVAGGENFVDFDDVRVGAPGENQQWGEGSLPERFQKDRLMRNWASDASAWKRDASGTWWHTGDFFTSATLQMPLPKLEAGESVQLLLAADPTNARAGARYSIARPSQRRELRVGWADGSAVTVPLREGAPLRLGWSDAKNGVWTLSGALGNRVLAASTRAPRGVKIGVRLLRGGAPLPVAPLQKVSLSAATFERDGRAAVGVNITPVSSEIARQLGLPDALGAAVDHVEEGSPAQQAGVREGDIIRGAAGARVADVDSMRAAVGAVPPGSRIELEILRPSSEADGVDWAKCIATTSDVLDYAFTSAPVDWRAARGTWDVAERWTCSPQWSFFSGQGDVSPLLWSRFAARGDWTLEAYLATPMDLTRPDRSPSDLNLCVGADGSDLASGYSFIFAGQNKSLNQIRRGDAVAWQQPFAALPGMGDAHQDWFYVRLEKRQTPRGTRFRYSVNGRLLADYLDPKPLPDGGHLGFWTQNGGISIARVRLWHSGLRVADAQPDDAVPAPPPLSNPLGLWSARGQGRQASARLVSTAQNGAAALQITDPRAGGDWTTFVTRTPFDVRLHPTLEWDARVPNGVKLNLYALVDDVWREIGWTGGASSNDPADVAQLGSVTGFVADGQWHHARFDLAQALQSRGISLFTVQALAFAAPNRDYLLSGLGGNHRGATYWLRDFKSSGR